MKRTFVVVYRLPGKDAERWTVEAKDHGDAEKKTLEAFPDCILGIVKETTVHNSTLGPPIKTDMEK